MTTLANVIQQTMTEWRIGYDPADTGPTMSEAIATAVRSYLDGLATGKKNRSIARCSEGCGDQKGQRLCSYHEGYEDALGELLWSTADD